MASWGNRLVGHLGEPVDHLGAGGDRSWGVMAIAAGPCSGADHLGAGSDRVGPGPIAWGSHGDRAGPDWESWG